MGNIFFNIKQLLRIGVYSNIKIKRSNIYLNKLFLGIRFGVPIIQYDMLIEYFHLIRIFILNLVQKNGTLLFYDDTKRLENILPFYVNSNNQQYILGRWIPGTLTNFKMLHYNFKKANQILLSKYPTAVFYFNENDNDVLLKECFFFNIPVLSIVDYNTLFLFYYTYIIPGHRRSYKFLVFIFYLLNYYLRKYLCFKYKKKLKIIKRRRRRRYRKLGLKRFQDVKNLNLLLFTSYYDIMMQALKLKLLYYKKNFKGLKAAGGRNIKRRRWKRMLYYFLN